MIPTGRLWLTLSLLAIPTIVAGFIEGVWPLVVLIDVAAVALGVADFLAARATKVQVWRELPRACRWAWRTASRSTW